MALVKVVVFGFLLALGSISAQDTGAEQSIDAEPGIEVYTKILGQSGKIRISSSPDFAPDDTVVIQLSSMAERGKKSGGTLETFTKREFKTFANQDFVFSPLKKDDKYPGTEFPVSSFSFSTDVIGNGDMGNLGNVIMTVYLFKEDAELDVDGEKSSVAKGSVKFNVKVNQYNFCTEQSNTMGCDGVGEELRVAIEVKGKKGEKIEKKTADGSADEPEDYSLGGSAAMKVSKKVSVDGTWKDLANAPRLEEQGSSQMLIIDLPKFASEVIYDPTVDINGSSHLTAFHLAVLSTALITTMENLSNFFQS